MLLAQIKENARVRERVRNISHKNENSSFLLALILP